MAISRSGNKSNISYACIWVQHIKICVSTIHVAALRLHSVVFIAYKREHCRHIFQNWLLPLKIIVIRQSHESELAFSSGCYQLENQQQD